MHSPYSGGMRKSVHSEEYQLVLAKLIAMRKEAGLTQRALAKRLDREYSFVWRIEKGERRLDVVEFYWVCQALEKNAKTVYKELVSAIESMSGRAPSKKTRKRPRS
ncbi:MAG TPA: XRE family transcriptional regulator [Verrucomicrobia bacterium]|nr:XRE family transcriptional regulator [Verrucomicrobiota bacterium]